MSALSESSKICSRYSSPVKSYTVGKDVCRMHLTVILVWLTWVILPVAVDGLENPLHNLRNRRYASGGPETHDMHTANCFDAFKKCRRTPQCRAALHGIHVKCKVVSGHCSAEMVDLPRCALIMDNLYEFGFSDKKCKCDQTQKRCNVLISKVYDNPCFSSIKHLRANNLFPEEIDAYDRVGGYVPPSSDPFITNQGVASSRDPADEEETVVSDYDKFVSSDDGYAKELKTRVRTKTQKSKPSVDEKVRNEMLTKPASKYLQVPKPSVRAPRKISTTAQTPKQVVRIVRQDNTGYSSQTLKVQHVKLIQYEGKIVQPREKSWQESNMDFKLIAIVLGALLGSCILIAVIFFAWTRAQGEFMFTSGKLICDYKPSGGMQTKHPCRPLPSNQRQAGP